MKKLFPILQMNIRIKMRAADEQSTNNRLGLRRAC